jgi:hypothetical protein
VECFNKVVRRNFSSHVNNKILQRGQKAMQINKTSEIMYTKGELHKKGC